MKVAIKARVSLAAVGHRSRDDRRSPLRQSRLGELSVGPAANPFTRTSATTSPALGHVPRRTAIGEWSASTVLKLTRVPGGSRSRNCRPTTGRIEVCNRPYGRNGWLGLAQIWVSGIAHHRSHQEVNDSYFNAANDNTPPWHRLVMCQEVAHDFGLDHQDETFDNPNLGTCMDYTNDPDGGGAYGPGQREAEPARLRPTGNDLQPSGQLLRRSAASARPTGRTVRTSRRTGVS